MARIDDVARLAGVSTATVSRALRGLPVVSEQTRARVAEAAATLGYVPSPSASRLAGGRTGLVGVVVPRLTRWFFATVVEAAEAILRRAGWDLLLYNLGGQELARCGLFDAQMLSQRVDAVLLVGTPLRSTEVAALAALRVPGATVSSGTPVPGWPGYRIDDVAAARTATGHLLALGHTRIAHLTVAPSDELSFSRHPDRRAGYRAALRGAGLTVDPRLTVSAEFTVAGGEAATRELLRRRDRPTAIFAACDEMAMGALRELRRARLRVPDEMSVIGIDDHDLAAAVGLTTIAQPAAEQGRAAASYLLRRLRGEPPWEAMPAALDTILVVRETTGHPPGC